MNLTYRILWVDDDETFFESQSQILEALEEYIEGEGFDLDVQFRTSPDDIAIDTVGRDFDLMVVDYNLTENGQNGDDVIRAVRDYKFLTEVIFYSGNAANNLRQFAAEKQLDGVFFSTKDADALLGKVLSVFDLTIRKVIDVENMRGIVMAGVADIDHQLTDLLRTLHNKLSHDKQLGHRRKLFGKMLPALSSVKRLVHDGEHDAFTALQLAIDGVKELEPREFEHLIGERSFDSHKRVESVESLCKDIEVLAEHKEEVKEIKELLKWRNALAHQRPTVDRGIHYFAPTEGKPEAFDEQRRKELRKILRQHRLQLDVAHKKVMV